MQQFSWYDQICERKGGGKMAWKGWHLREIDFEINVNN